MLHSMRILGDACEKFRTFSVEGTELSRAKIDDMVSQSLYQSHLRFRLRSLAQAAEIA
jgi:fumarate hydratase class II